MVMFVGENNNAVSFETLLIPISMGTPRHAAMVPPRVPPSRHHHVTARRAVVGRAIAIRLPFVCLPALEGERVCAWCVCEGVCEGGAMVCVRSVCAECVCKVGVQRWVGGCAKV